MGGDADQSVVHGICFHGVGPAVRELEPGEARFWITVGAFHRILDVIAGRTDVRISFDDGNASDLDIGLVALRERGMVASFFVIAGRIGLSGSLDVDGLRELSRHGMTVGSHGMDHRPWRRLSTDDRRREFVEARDRIAAVLGQPVDQAAVPMGLYDRQSLTCLRRLGYTAVHTSERMASREGAWLQPRFSVHSDDTPDSVVRHALTDATRSRRAWLVAKGALKRLR